MWRRPLVPASIRACTLNVDQGRLPDSRAGDSLPTGRALPFDERAQRDESACARRLIQRLHDPHVLEPFLAGRLRLAVLDDAVGELQQLRSKLITLDGLFPLGAAIEGQRVLESFRVLVRRVGVEV